MNVIALREILKNALDNKGDIDERKSGYQVYRCNGVEDIYVKVPAKHLEICIAICNNKYVLIQQNRISCVDNDILTIINAIIGCMRDYKYILADNMYEWRR